ncbi:dentin sialophosphoprotein-like [Cotesia glomerata]|uniref:BEN domain-containing protein n=1 Tax=Cotesia glomerata TaxID=32391 RepID=A0AAV7HYV6_COTGL|nr:dentin sialophosphoprotein-like [Cotesia glomerata]KAH0539633.1 hypothetical protein KQX54_006433 [Cotesia glomerata]
MPSKKLDNRVHKRLVLQVQKYREAQKQATRKSDDSSKSSDSSDHGYSDHEEDQNRSHESVSSKKNQNDSGSVGICDKVTTEDIKNLVLASYRSLSKQITNLSDQIEDATSRLSTLESLVKNVGTLAEKPEETFLNEEVLKTRGSLTKNKDIKDVENVVIIKDSESSDSGSSSSSKSDSDSSSETESESKKKEKNSIEVFDTSVRLRFPLQTEYDFCIFNAKIAKYGYRNRVINDLSHMVNKNSSLSRNVEKMIRHYLTKNVTMRYNTKISTIKKKAFIDTLFYECIEEVIKKIFGESKPISDERIHVSITAALKFRRKK